MLSDSIDVLGVMVDQKTRCVHYHTEKDVIAIKHRCCQTYYACIKCHLELANHEPAIWKKEQFNEKAVLCGVCQTELSINEYMASKFQCPYCKHEFNERCSLHYGEYFEVDSRNG